MIFCASKRLLCDVIEEYEKNQVTFGYCFKAKNGPQSTLKISDKKSVFINAGRGNVIEDSQLLQALDKNWLSFAILDVFNQEPLPQNHPFWRHEKVLVTPHISALSRPCDIVECFVKNLDLYLAGKPLENPIDWNEGY